MNMHPEHPEGVDPLLSEEHEQSVRIDLSSSHAPLPDGLVQRTFEASVAYLPNQQPLVVTVAEVKTDSVVLDANHPLAGEDLTFDIELVELV